ncbi:DUF418 domain-containing protein [Jeotgalibacillus campisalis]|uniref:DUF418 domain-containing protein n=1 Tax=Jeotgalibacillus campisalis TaxID=220754 RepID=A0A0C2RAM6_9BACL|nr:DUF418 domain-containing protein [Jeotgalibacillus campisalis]KIL47370.1 hypothetical protein KR50_15370 [Jeotgalibacillus campisalis]
MKEIQPIDQQNRIQSLDVMRGFSLLGIFIVNMIAFHSPIYYYNPYSWWGNTVDRPVYWWIDVFVQASFYPLFTILFGFGLALQYGRSIEKGTTFYPFALKRLGVLLFIGTIHAFIIWSGDILISYAVVGFLLLLLLQLEGKLLLVIGLLLFLLPQVLISAIFIVASIADPTSVTYFNAVQEIQSSIEAYGNGTISDIFSQRLSDWLYANNPASFLSLAIALLPLMMIGAGVSKMKLIEKAADKKKSLILIILLTLPAALVLKTSPYWMEKNLAYSFIQDFVGGPLLAVSYMALLALLMTRKKAAKWLRPLAQTGRMSLTNYLMQSIAGTLIFYSYGLGLYGEISLLTGFYIAIGLFAIQVILSDLWLSKFSQGPVEFVWRRLTYGKNVK